MRAREFMAESKKKPSLPNVDRSLPGAWIIPALKNQDPYLQYRFGVALAGAKGAEQRSRDEVPEYSRESTFGENEVIVRYAGETDKFIDDALQFMGLSPSDKKAVGDIQSLEDENVQTKSPINSFKGYPR